MTYKENITAILEVYFTGFKKEIIDGACNRILELEQQRSVRLQEPKTGHWIDEIISIPLSDGSKECVRCSQCGLHYDVASYYCPNCGCRMIEPQESEDRNE